MLHTNCSQCDNIIGGETVTDDAVKLINKKTTTIKCINFDTMIHKRREGHAKVEVAVVG